MEENNLNNEQINTVPTEGVAPVEPAAPTTPVAPVAPVEPAAPVAPVAPVAPEAPVAPATPVVPATPAAPQPQFTSPAQAVAQPIEQPVQPVAPQQPVGQGVPLAQPTPPKKNKTFTIIVIVLILAIIGAAVYVILDMNKSKKSSGSTTTTTTENTNTNTTTTEKITVTSVNVTTNPNTTTYPRTTRAVDEPMPTSSNDQTFTINGYKFTVPSGYTYQVGTGGVPILIDSTKTIEMNFYIFKEYTLGYYAENLDKLISEFQKQGYTVNNVEAYRNGTKDYLVFYVTDPSYPEFNAYYVFTSLDSFVIEAAMMTSKDYEITKLLTEIKNVVDTGTKQFAGNGESSVGTSIDFKGSDKLDTRLLQK